MGYVKDVLLTVMSLGENDKVFQILAVTEGEFQHTHRQSNVLHIVIGRNDYIIECARVALEPLAELDAVAVLVPQFNVG